MMHPIHVASQSPRIRYADTFCSRPRPQLPAFSALSRFYASKCMTFSRPLLSVSSYTNTLSQTRF